MGWFGGGKTISSVMEEAFKKGLEMAVNQQGNPEQFKQSVQGIFQTKLGRVNGDKNQYIESMLSNVGYLVLGCEYTYSYFHHQIKDKTAVVTGDQYWGWVKQCQDHVRNELPQKVEERFRVSFSKFSNVDQKIDELEFNYLHSSAQHQIILVAVCELMTNKNTVEFLRGQNFEEVMQTFMQWKAYATNFRIGNLNQKAG